MDTLFDIAPDRIDDTCRHCAHRVRYGIEHSLKVKQCCEMRPTARNQFGYAYIKVTDPACAMFEMIRWRTEISQGNGGINYDKQRKSKVDSAE